MRPEKAIFRPGIEHATPRGVADFFGEVFAALTAHPRPILVEIDWSEAEGVEPVVLDMEKGEPLFTQRGGAAAHGRFGGRWLAELAVPCTFNRAITRFRLLPADAGRIRVRLVRPCLLFWYNILKFKGC